jgi:hypothetical protein
VGFVHAFSEVLGEAAGLVSANDPFVLLFHLTFLRQVPFQPAKLIFVGINTLFAVRVSYLLTHVSDIHSYQAADGVSASYDALLELFECIGSFLKRLEIYTKISLTPLMTEIIVKILFELLSILAQAKKQIKQGRFSTRPLP